MARTQCLTEYIAMIEIWKRVSTFSPMVLWSLARKCCSAKFLLVLFDMLSAEHETYNAFVAVRCGRTEHDAYHETLHGTV